MTLANVLSIAARGMMQIFSAYVYYYVYGTKALNIWTIFERPFSKRKKKLPPISWHKIENDGPIGLGDASIKLTINGQGVNKYSLFCNPNGYLFNCL